MVSQGYMREMRKRLASGEERPASEGHLFPLAGTFTGKDRARQGWVGQVRIRCEVGRYRRRGR